MNKLYIILFFSTIGLFSCFLTKKTNPESNLLNNTYSEKELINKTNSKNITPDWASFNAKIKINKGGQETKINARIRIKKDSVIWVSIKAPLGIEAFRIMITPDSIYYMSRMNKNYFIKNISRIREVVKLDISFTKIQELLFASPKITDLNSNTENYEILKDIFRIHTIDFQDIKGDKISIRYSDYKAFAALGGLFFPSNLFLEIQSKENFEIEINYTKIEFNKTFSISFKIPTSYDPIN